MRHSSAGLSLDSAEFAGSLRLVEAISHSGTKAGSSMMQSAASGAVPIETHENERSADAPSSFMSIYLLPHDPG
jgi:hypothetical protein